MPAAEDLPLTAVVLAGGCCAEHGLLQTAALCRGTPMHGRRKTCC